MVRTCWLEILFDRQSAKLGEWIRLLHLDATSLPVNRREAQSG